MNEIYMMVLITNRGMRENFITFFKENRIHVTLATLGSGTANSAILDYFGMEKSLIHLAKLHNICRK